MCPPEKWRRHEAAHAVAAVKMGFELGPNGIVFNGDGGPYTCIKEVPTPDDDRLLRRAAVKLAALAVEFPSGGEEPNLYPSGDEPDYYSDLDEADSLIRCMSSAIDGPHVIELRKRALAMAREVVEAHAGLIEAVARAAEKKCMLSAKEIGDIVAGV